MRKVLSALLVSLVTVAVSAAPAAAANVDPVVEAKNYSITFQRAAEFSTPAYQSKLLTIGSRNGLTAIATQLKDPGRFFTNNLCWNGFNGCAGDIRLYDWGPKQYGLVRPVLLSTPAWSSRASS